MFCSSCGVENDTGARFCRSCGAALAAGDPPAFEPPSEPAAGGSFGVGGTQSQPSGVFGGAAPGQAPAYGAGPAIGGSGPSGPRASFGQRFLAALLDGLLVGVVGLVLRVVIGSPAAGLNLLLGLAYYAYLEGSASGQTVGKRAIGIRVIDFQTGGAIGPGRAVVRYLMRIVSGFACLLGYFWMLWDKERQTWHDKVAAAVVVPVSAYPVSAWPG